MNDYYWDTDPLVKLERCVNGKVCLKKKDAETRRNWLMKEGKEDYLRIYECPFCNFWHLTSKKKI